MDLSSKALVAGDVTRIQAMKHKQYAALPYRIVEAETRILLITTRKKGRWSVPKGWPMKRRTPSKAAAREAFEEAGILGLVGPDKVGRFKHRKIRGSRKVRCAVDVFPFAVRGTLKDWPEKHERKRRWFTPEEAANRVRAKGLRRAISNMARQA